MNPARTDERRQKEREWYRNRTPEQKLKKKLKHRDWYKNTSEEKREATKARMRANRSRITAEEKEKRKAYNRIWTSKLTDEQRKKRQETQNKWRASVYSKTPQVFLQVSHRRRARLIGAGGSYTESEWRELVDKYGHRCLRCGRPESEVKLTADHVVPLIKGGSNNIENIQPLCRRCNSRKQARTMDFRSEFDPTIRTQMLEMEVKEASSSKLAHVGNKVQGVA
jgi:5-methylcytosine-specific restriction endonuclease McrA